MFHRILIASVVGLITAAAARADEHVCDKTPFTDFLFSVGDKLDCYFTIETWQRGGDHQSSFYDAKSTGEKISSSDALIAKFRRDLPGVTILRDPANDRIIHLIDAGLSNRDGYPLEKKASIDYSGPLEDLPNQLGKSMWYAVRRSDPLGCDFQSDVVTMVKVHFEGKTIRQILTDSVPLKKYGRILWIAQTYGHRSDNRTASEITYIGPRLTRAAGKNEGAVVEVSLPAELTLGRRMPATVVIRNTGDKPFYCMEVGPLPNDKMEIKLTDRDTNQPVKMSARGQQIMESISMAGAGVGLGRLEKGESIEWPIDLAEFYTLPPGRYRLKIKLHLYRDLTTGREFPVSVDPVDFVVAR